MHRQPGCANDGSIVATRRFESAKKTLHFADLSPQIAGHCLVQILRWILKRGILLRRISFLSTTFGGVNETF